MKTKGMPMKMYTLHSIHRRLISHARVGLETGHVQVGDQVDDPHRPGHEGDAFQLAARPLDHFEQALHHAAGDQSFTSCLITGQVVKEGEEGSGKGLREWFSV